MKLSDKERLLLAAIEHQADLPVPVIQKQTKLQAHTIRYFLSRLKERQIILGQSPFINLYPLGYTDYTIYFSLSAQSQQLSQNIIKRLLDSKSISWVAKVGGEYQLGIAICTKRVEDVSKLIASIEKDFGDFFHQKSISVRLNFNAFGRKYLSSKFKSARTLTMRQLSDELVTIDALDQQILSGLSNLEYSSDRHLARLLNIPFATLIRRLQRLKAVGIIAGYIYRFNLSQHEIQTYRLLIYARGTGADFAKELYKYASEHPQILHMIECIGAWDYELGIEVQYSEQVTELIQSLYQRFGQKINEVKMLQIFKHLKYSAYPF